MVRRRAQTRSIEFNVCREIFSRDEVSQRSFVFERFDRKAFQKPDAGSEHGTVDCKCIDRESTHSLSQHAELETRIPFTAKTIVWLL